MLMGHDTFVFHQKVEKWFKRLNIEKLNALFFHFFNNLISSVLHENIVCVSVIVIEKFLLEAS